MNKIKNTQKTHRIRKEYVKKNTEYAKNTQNIHNTQKTHKIHRKHTECKNNTQNKQNTQCKKFQTAFDPLSPSLIFGKSYNNFFRNS